MAVYKRVIKGMLSAGMLLGQGLMGGFVVAAEPATIADIHLVEGEAVVELSGSGFGEGPNVVFFDDFQSADDGERLSPSDIRVGTFNASRPPIYTTYDGVTGEKGILIRERLEDGTSKTLQSEIVFDSTDEALIHYAVHIPDGMTWPMVTDGNQMTFGDTSSWKFAWLMDGSRGDASTSIFDMCLPTHTGKGGLQLAGNGGGFYGESFGKWWDWHGVNNITVWVSKSKTAIAANVGNVYWRTINGNGVTEINYPEREIQKSSVVIKFDRVKIPGWMRLSAGDNFNAIYDNIYVAAGKNSKARVEITDTKDASAAHFVILVPPLTWSDDRITFRIPGVISGAREEFFVRVYDANGASSSVPARICLNCPRPPLLSK